MMLATEGQELTCKCGGELTAKLIGDECALRCRDCGRLWLNEEAWMRQAAPAREFSPEQQAIIDAAHAEADEEGPQS